LITSTDALQATWSPHGHRIAYWGLRKGGQRDIWTIPASGGEPEDVTNDEPLDWNPVWSPDGSYLYFASDRGGSMNLWRVRIDEISGKVDGQPEPVTTPSQYSQHISFSRDGHRVVYVQVVTKMNIQRVGFDPVGEKVVGQPEWVTQGSKRSALPNISPDGEWLVFSSFGEKQEDLFVIRKDGTGLRQLTDDIYKDRFPRWSPDGKRIAAHSDRSGKYELWLINPDGSGLRQLTSTSAPNTVLYPVWSPDGTRIAYTINEVNTSIVDANRSWNEQSPESLPGASESNTHFSTPFSWSTDGRRLAGWAVGGSRGIIVYSLESRTYEKLTDAGSFPVWLSDNRRLLFIDQRKIQLVDSQTKKVHEVLSAAPYAIGQGFSLTRDDRLIYYHLTQTEADIWLMTME
jgi:Tol biopolymer transport system component